MTVKPREVTSLTVSLDVAGSPRPSTSSQILRCRARTRRVRRCSRNERLEQMPLAQRTNLPDAIVTAAPGMIRGHDDFVHIRGHEVALNPSINGVQFWENAHSVFSPGLGVDYIESINVMTGGFSAEYGNRFGGILDVVTKSGFSMRNRGSRVGSGRERRSGTTSDSSSAGDASVRLTTSTSADSRRTAFSARRRRDRSTTPAAACATFGRLDFRGTDRDRHQRRPQRRRRELRAAHGGA